MFKRLQLGYRALGQKDSKTTCKVKIDNSDAKAILEDHGILTTDNATLINDAIKGKLQQKLEERFKKIDHAAIAKMDEASKKELTHLYGLLHCVQYLGMDVDSYDSTKNPVVIACLLCYKDLHDKEKRMKFADGLKELYSRNVQMTHQNVELILKDPEDSFKQILKQLPGSQARL